jgi:hypothetical protein
MVVLTNRRLGPSVELLLSTEIAVTILREVTAAATPRGRWEHELVRWLERRAGEPARGSVTIDVSDIAWTPEHFDAQRCFLVDAIERALPTSRHAEILRRWMVMIAAHPRDSVQFGRRWQWSRDAVTT